MMNRFLGEAGRRLRVEAFKNQPLVARNTELAEKLADMSVLLEIASEESIINQGDYSNDIYFILIGSFKILVNGREVARRSAGSHIGEMGVIEPTQERSATVTATQQSLIAKIDEAQFDELGKQYPELYKLIAKELAHRLLERNRLIKPLRERIRLFIICSVEALPVARLIHNGLQHDLNRPGF